MALPTRFLALLALAAAAIAIAALVACDGEDEQQVSSATFPALQLMADEAS